jgi:hypothetical protein
MTAYRIGMQAICQLDQAQAIREYLQVIPGFYAIGQPQRINPAQARIDFSIVVREELQEGTLLSTAQERVGQYLWQRPDVQPVHITALTEERLPADEESHMAPEHIPPRRSL